MKPVKWESGGFCAQCLRCSKDELVALFLCGPFSENVVVCFAPTNIEREDIEAKKCYTRDVLHLLCVRSCVNVTRFMSFLCVLVKSFTSIVDLACLQNTLKHSMTDTCRCSSFEFVPDLVLKLQLYKLVESHNNSALCMAVECIFF